MIDNQLPSLHTLFEVLPDPRGRREYTMNELLFGALTMNLLKSGSRNSYNNLRRDSQFRSNFAKTFKKNLPHADAFDEVLREIKPAQLESVKHEIVSHFIENKSLRKYRAFNNFYLVAVDATGIASYDKKHCEHCLTKTSKNGVTSYFHYVLEAKLVTYNGFCISLASEFVENLPDRDFDKQDCEQKAFVRLAAKIKKHFPRLPICILADGLYPNQTVFDICKKNAWKFIITLKDKSLKTFQEEVGLLKCTSKPRHIIIPDKNWKIEQECRFLNKLEYEGFDYSWVSCLETKTSIKTGEILETHFAYITNIEQSLENVIETASNGRLRWKIENQGFNTQKNGEYELEHKYSRVCYPAMQNYYCLLQIAHIINQLVEKSLAIKMLLNEHSKTTISDLWRALVGYLTFANHTDFEILLE